MSAEGRHKRSDTGRTAAGSVRKLEEGAGKVRRPGHLKDSKFPLVMGAKGHPRCARHQAAPAWG
jgi:hypothetical protein